MAIHFAQSQKSVLRPHVREHVRADLEHAPPPAGSLPYHLQPGFVVRLDLFDAFLRSPEGRPMTGEHPSDRETAQRVE